MCWGMRGDVLVSSLRFSCLFALVHCNPRTPVRGLNREDSGLTVFWESDYGS